MRLAAEILLAYRHTRAAMRRATLDTVLANTRAGLPGKTLPRPNQRRAELAEARHLGHAVARTLSLVPGDTRCLVRSLVLTRLLSNRGMDSKLVIGTRTSPEFLAHAWVELAGQPLLSSGDGAFARLVEL
jgi:hypothetical protein